MVLGHQFEEQGGQLDRGSLWRGRLWPWWRHRDETSLCEAGRFVYILLIGVDISERIWMLELDSFERIVEQREAAKKGN